jgi:hypothetical protein
VSLALVGGLEVRDDGDGDAVYSGRDGGGALVDLGHSVKHCPVVHSVQL